MGLRLQRHLGDVRAILPGQYAKHEGATFVCCPACGGVDQLRPDKHVVRDERVTPAWKCPQGTCAVLEWLTLESFGEPVLT